MEGAEPVEIMGDRMPYGRSVITLACAATAVLGLSRPPAAAQTVVKIGNISSYSGFVAQAADQAQKAVDLYVKEHEKELPPGIKLEIMRRDDTSNPEVGKRLAQELIKAHCGAFSESNG